MMLCMFVGAAWAQWPGLQLKTVSTTSATELTDGYYVIYNNGRGTFLNSESEGGQAKVTWPTTASATGLEALNSSEDLTNQGAKNRNAYVFYANVEDGGKVSLKTGYGDYAPVLTSNVTFDYSATEAFWNYSVKIDGENGFVFLKSDNNVGLDCNGWSASSHTYSNAAGWTADGSQNVSGNQSWTFYPVEMEESLVDPRIPQLTTDENNPIWYTIKNVRGNAYAAYDGDGESIKLRPTAESAASLFYFTEGTVAGTFKIHNYANDLLCEAPNSWTEEGIDWYIKVSDCASPTGVAISNDATLTADGGEAWNDFQGNHTSVNWYGGNDAGSVWAIEKYEGAAPGIQLSTGNDIKLHFIRSIRRDTYVNFDGHNSTFKEGEKGLNSYWYFVQDAEAQASAPEGFIACKIFNAAHATGVENFTSGYMEDSSWPAKVFYIGLCENDRYGYVIHLPGDSNGWHDFGGTHIGSYGLGDNGSLWRIYTADKTAAQLISEATTAKNNAMTYISAAEEADFFTHPAEDIATAKATVEGTSVSKLHEAVGELLNGTISEALTTLQATAKGTTAPAAGQYIQLKNRNYSKYLKATETGLTSVNDATDFATLWYVVEGTEGNVKLQNALTEKYIGEIRQSADVAMVDEAEAKQFAFTNQTDVYAVFHETTGGGYAYGHIAGGNNLVGWEAGAAASQWIVSEVSKDEALAELQAIYDVVENAFGDQPGQYKQSMEEVDNSMYITVEAFVKDMLAPEAVVDAYTAKKTVATLKAQWDAVKTTVREINAPAQGKFYRLKNVASGNYMNGLGNEVKLLADGASVHTTIFYLGDNNTLVSYNSGRYLDCSAKGYSAVGDAKSGAFAMAYNGAQANVFTYKNNDYSTYGAGADGGNLDRGSSDPDHIGYNWILEEVTWLPIPVNVEAGWTSLYSPVELELSSNRFKAYTVNSVTSEVAKLTEQSVVPAGVGVVLELQDGAQIDNDCVYLQIKETETTGVESMLLGTYADAYIPDAAYALGLIDGEVGFYTAAMNQQGNTSWLNNGFKAYLPKPAGSGANALRFNFGGETTAIESVLNNGVDANAPIYDLSGRRVNNAVKGGIYIQNGKKFIVK